MSHEFDPLASYRATVARDLEAVVDNVRLTHVEILKHELRLINEGRPTGRVDLSPPAACLLIADALGAEQRQALPLATSLGLMMTMASIFQELEADDVHGGESLETAWGMPRSLNAGDAFFVLAQQSILRDSGLDESRIFEASAVLSTASRALSEDIYASRRRDALRLLPQALALGAVAAGANEATISELKGFAETLARDGFDATQQALQTMSINDQAKSRLEEMAAFLVRGR
jgi:hypothetical protein